ncbi:hypothetical protein, partial [Streptomyces alkaliterrae]
MNSAPHLRLEDRPEFERVLDEALRHAAARTATGPGRRTEDGRLRARALADAATIAAAAAPEYAEYVHTRERLRQPATAGGGQPGPGGAPARPGGPGRGSGSGPEEKTGAGLFAVASVLVPVLAGAAAVIFLTVGYALHLVSPEPDIAASMRNVGWVFAAIAVATALVGAVTLLLTALRNSSSAIRPGSVSGHGLMAGSSPTSDDVAAARAAWRHALLHRGILPYLRETASAETASTETASGDPAADPSDPSDPPRTTVTAVAMAVAPMAITGSSR